MTQLNVESVEEYLTNKLGKKYKTLREKATSHIQKIIAFLDKIKNSIQKITHCKDMETLSSLSMESKKYEIAAKSAEKLSQNLIETVEKIQISDETSYNNLVNIIEQLKTLFNNVNKIGRKWVPKISPWFKNELKELDYYIRKLAQQSDKFSEFLYKDYKVIENLDKIQQLQKNIIEAKNEKNEVNNQITSLKNEIQKLNQRITEVENKLQKFMQSGVQKELSNAKEELTSLRHGFNAIFNPILKPLKKFSKSPSNFKSRLTSKQRNLIDEYIEQPFNTLLKEEEGLPDLKAMLTALKLSLQNNELELKKSRVDKGIRQINKIIKENALDSIYKKAKELNKSIREFKDEISQSGIIGEQEKIKQVIEELKNELTDKKVNLNRLENNLSNLNEKIERDIELLEKKIKEIIQEHVSLTL
ncbi:MAG: hypothetical protein ACTSYR_01320 [Candidatus Odinarchaeia archaeon]